MAFGKRKNSSEMGGPKNPPRNPALHVALLMIAPSQGRNCEDKMAQNKNGYRAWAINSQGASTDAGYGTNLNALKAEIRRTFGSGWEIHIDKIEHDSGCMDFAPMEIAVFTIR